MSTEPVASVGDPEPATKKDTSPPMTAEQVVTATGGTVKGDTSYVLLSLSGPNQWMVEATVEARTGEAAIRQYFADEDGEGADAVVAVPERSWKPVRISKKTTTTLVIEEAS